MSAVNVAAFNAALDHPTIRATVRHLAKSSVPFDSRALVEAVVNSPDFPRVSVADLIAAVRAAGVPLRGGFADLAELHTLPLPLLTYLKRSPDCHSSMDLTQIERLGPRVAVVSSDRFGTEKIDRNELVRRWSGVVLVANPDLGGAIVNEAVSYQNQVTVFPGMLTTEECLEIIEYCEQSCFKRSRVMQRSSEKATDVVMQKIRSSTSTILHDRRHPILAKLYAHCAHIEGVTEADIELMQCVRYKRGQKFRAHFDAGVELPRRTTYLLYLNDNFEGGETYFSMINHSVSPVTGSCLRFPSCDDAGRILWPSEHGGLPVGNGVKYALNIWVRCPTGRVS